MEIREAKYEDLPEILWIQKRAFAFEAELHNNFDIQPLRELLEEVQKQYLNGKALFLVAEHENMLVGAVRVNIDDGICIINKLIVDPHQQKKGIGAHIMSEVERKFNQVKKYELFTALKSEHNVRFYKKLGYKISGKEAFFDDIHFVYLEKENEKVLSKS